MGFQINIDFLGSFRRASVLDDRTGTVLYKGPGLDSFEAAREDAEEWIRDETERREQVRKANLDRASRVATSRARVNLEHYAEVERSAITGEYCCRIIERATGKTIQTTAWRIDEDSARAEASAFLNEMALAGAGED